MRRRSLRAEIVCLCGAVLLAGCSDATGPSAPSVAGVILGAASDSVVVGGSLQLVATVVGSGGTVVSGASVQWSSLVPGLASVNAAGVVSGLGIGIVGIRAATGDFADTLFVRVRPRTCTAAQVTGSITMDAAANGTLDATDCGFFGGVRAEGRSITLASPTVLRVRASSAAFAATVVITDNTLNYYTAGGAGAPGAEASAVASLPAGTYLLWVLGGSETETGSWTMSASTVTACSSSTLQGTVSPGETVVGVVTDASCVLPNALPGSGWGLSVASDTTLRFAISSTEFYPVVILTRTNPELDIVGVAFSDGTGLATLRTNLTAGEYLVWAMPSDGRYGAYSLAVEGTTLPSCTALDGTIAPGQTVQGALADDDCSLGARYADLWELTLATSTTVQLDLTSAAFDTYLLLRNASGATIAEDDDGGSGLNSRIAITLPAGTYTVVTTSFGSFSTGQYSLAAAALGADVASLRRVPAPSVPKSAPRRLWESPR